MHHTDQKSGLRAGARDANQPPASGFAIARTSAGEIRGRFHDGVYTFKGVRYGEDTASRRFRAAEPVRPWTGVRDALEFGHQCLQPPSPDWELLRSGWDQPTGASEDCLNLNIWTPGLADGKRRPVMVNLHGGGWTVGTGNSSGRSGERFARHHDVVRVNVNHRLGIFGYSNMAELLGEEYATSGTVGMQDVVLALEWVRDNIEAFGGDPGNVTIFGVSGGGGKVSTLMAMPAARDLFHRASVESGPMLTANLPGPAAQAAARLLSALEIPAARARDILALTGEQVLSGFLKLHPDGGLLTAGLAPVVDGTSLPRHPFDPTAPEVSDHVPLLIGTTLSETSIFEQFLGGPVAGLTWNDVETRLAKFLPPAAGARVPEMITSLRSVMPDASPTQMLYMTTTELLIRNRSTRQAELASRRPAPVYVWLVEWCTPVDGGKWGSPHGITVPLIMDTVDSAAGMFGDGLEAARSLSSVMSSTWAAFARTGVPAAPGLPAWPHYDTAARQTMIFDTSCRVVADPHAELRRMFALPG